MDLDPIQAAHLAPNGPAAIAGAWFAAIVDQAELASAWSLTDYPLRLALAQSWLMSTQTAFDEGSRDRVAAEIADGIDSEYWGEFVEWRLTRWRENTFRAFVDHGWGLVSIPEMAGPDVEFVRMAQGGQVRELSAGEAELVQTLTLRLVNGSWLIAGIGRTLAVPGWPPTEHELPTDFGLPESLT
ncbi:MAG TPA: hypothetical protein VJA46_05790 [Acidimicrobiia bacterium]|nr:hypothetical protein [Acidimicrobiia bacterium]